MVQSQALETAEFWLSRATNRNGRLEILDVIGPDEYTEHIDNNTYTNYMAHYNVEKALEWNKDNADFVARAEAFLEKIYLPVANESGLIPQDDTFLEKDWINLDKYKAKTRNTRDSTRLFSSRSERTTNLKASRFSHVVLPVSEDVCTGCCEAELGLL